MNTAAQQIFRLTGTDSPHCQVRLIPGVTDSAQCLMEPIRCQWAVSYENTYRCIHAFAKQLAKQFANHQNEGLTNLALHDFTISELQEISSVGAYVLNISAGTWESSPVLDKLFGIGKEYNHCIEGWVELLHPEDRAMMLAYLEDEVIGQRKPFDKMYRIIRYDDRAARWMHGLGKLTFDEQGCPLHMLGTIQDITLEKLREEKLLQNQERLSLAQQASLAGIWDWNVTTGEIVWSAELFLIFGLPPATTKASFEAWRKIIHPEDLLEAEERIHNAILTCTPLSSDYRIVLPSGEVRWIESLGDISFDDQMQPLRMTGICIDITKRKLVEEQVTLAASVFAHANEGILVTDTEGTILEANNTFSLITGYEHSEVLGRNPRILSSGRQSKEFYVAMWRDLKEKGQWSGEIWNRHKDGCEYAEMLTISSVRDDHGKSIRYIALFSDITERKQAELHSNLCQFAMENASFEIFWLDKNAHIYYVNKKACQTLGYTNEELLKLSIPDIDPLFPAGQWNSHWDQLKRDKSLLFETQHKCKDGRIIPVEVSANYVEFSNHEYNIAYVRDISHRKKIENELQQLAFYDSLTNLPNRRLLDDRLALVMASSKRSGCYCALMFLDLDNFKPLNDAHGHGAGDLLLVETAERLRNCVRETDTVARFGGDEFVVVLSELNEDREESFTQARIVAEKILAAVGQPFHLSLKSERKADAVVEHHCTASIGIVIFINHESCHGDILKWADSAMYQAKQAGRSQIRFYEEYA